MNTRKKKNIMIGVLCSLLVFMGIGYAVLSQVLTINAGGKIKGNWNIYIESIEPYNIAGHAKSIESKIGTDKLSASIEAELNQPNDYVDYKVVVKNGGSIKAQLTNAALVQKKTNEYIEITSTAVSGTILDAGNTMDFIVTIKFKDVDSFDTQDETMSAITELQLSFMQVTSEGASDNTSAGGGSIAKQCFTVDSNGALTNYDYSCGTNVAIPADVNGTNIKTISSLAFLDYNLITVSSDSKFLLFDDTYYDALKQFLTNNCMDNAGSDGDTSQCADANISSVIYKKSTMNDTQYKDLINSEGLSGAYKLSMSNNELQIDGAVSRLTSVDFSDATYLETIEPGAFVGMDTDDITSGSYSGYDSGVNGSLTTVNFGSITNLTTIGDMAFAGNSISSLTLPTSSSTLNIGYGVFRANNISNATINSNLSGELSSMFRCNTSLTSSTLTLNNTTATADQFNLGTCSNE